MPLLEWSDDLDVGVPQMNNEHMQILKYMNQLYDLHQGNATPIEIEHTLGKLGEVTVDHFKDEEKYMESINFEGLAGHKLIHNCLLDKLTTHVDNFKATKKLDPILFDFLKVWLRSHIMGIDIKYGKGQSS